MQPIGGWTPVVDSSDAAVDMTDPIRGALGWKDNDAGAWFAAGTYNKAYGFSAGVLTDITPLSGFTAGTESATSASGLYNGGNYNAGLYNIGSGGGGGLTVVEANSWQFDNFGEQLIACAFSDGKIYYWDLNPANDLTVVDASAPLGNKGVVVTPERFVVALGGGSYAAPSTPDVRQLSWCDQEDYTEWNPAASGSQAGDFILPGTGAIMCGSRGRNETLIWTETDLFAMRYIGGLLVYSFAQVGANCGIISRRAKASVDNRFFWMGNRGFFMYDGSVRPLPCPIEDEIFPNLSPTQKSKVAAWANTDHNEVWFAYPTSGGGGENDKVVTYNYLENHWSGPWDLVRTDGIDRGAFVLPVMFDSEGAAVYHETGTDMYDEDGTTALIPAAESGPIELGAGDNVMTVRRYIPDEDTVGDVDLTVYASLYPTATEGSQVVTVGSLSDVRLTGRQVRLAIEQESAVGWRYGIPRLEVVPRGRR
jgi:hypothetical protein